MTSATFEYQVNKVMEKLSSKTSTDLIWHSALASRIINEIERDLMSMDVEHPEWRETPASYFKETMDKYRMCAAVLMTWKELYKTIPEMTDFILTWIVLRKVIWNAMHPDQKPKDDDPNYCMDLKFFDYSDGTNARFMFSCGKDRRFIDIHESDAYFIASTSMYNRQRALTVCREMAHQKK